MSGLEKRTPREEHTLKFLCHCPVCPFASMALMCAGRLMLVPRRMPGLAPARGIYCRSRHPATLPPLPAEMQVRKLGRIRQKGLRLAAVTLSRCAFFSHVLPDCILLHDGRWLVALRLSWHRREGEQRRRPEPGNIHLELDGQPCPESGGATLGCLMHETRSASPFWLSLSASRAPWQPGEATTSVPAVSHVVRMA